MIVVFPCGARRLGQLQMCDWTQLTCLPLPFLKYCRPWERRQLQLEVFSVNIGAEGQGPAVDVTLDDKERCNAYSAGEPHFKTWTGRS